RARRGRRLRARSAGRVRARRGRRTRAGRARRGDRLRGSAGSPGACAGLHRGHDRRPPFGRTRRVRGSGRARPRAARRPPDAARRGVRRDARAAGRPRRGPGAPRRRHVRRGRRDREVSRTLVLGGGRSGKSAFAESLLADVPAVEYVATAMADPGDVEWTARIAAHRARRPQRWSTLETSDIAGVLRRDGVPVLIDSITLWLSADLDDPGRVDDLCTAWNASARRVVAVSDEVGSGVVPT